MDIIDTFTHAGRQWSVLQGGDQYYARNDRGPDAGPFGSIDEARGWPAQEQALNDQAGAAAIGEQVNRLSVFEHTQAKAAERQRRLGAVMAEKAARQG